ncbi:MAG TPA: sugar phosphotransferase, partial [Methylomirabilota bacterium]|nr:sugar phosphotransferase [Methylomirabilota bacterium]
MASKSLPSDTLAGWIAGQRWFAAKSRRIVGTLVEDHLRVAGATLHVVRVGLDDGATHRYAVPLLDGPVPSDALDDPGFCRALLDVMRSAGRVGPDRGALLGRPSTAFPADLPADLPVRRLVGEQSNTSVVFGDRLIVKHIRRLVAGVNPELEMSRYLTERAGFANTPHLAGALEYLALDGTTTTFAIAHTLVRDASDGWRWLLARLQQGDRALPALAVLGRRTAELHRALARDAADPAFDAETITAADVAAWTAGVQAQLDAARAALGGKLPDGVPSRLDGRGLGGLVGAVKIRHHGDFHLGQTLTVRDGEDFFIIDFEGEPLRPLEERRRKHTPLRDVAGMLRSIGYAAASAPAPQGWEEQARAAFLEGYGAAAGGAPFLPA